MFPFMTVAGEGIGTWECRDGSRNYWISSGFEGQKAQINSEGHTGRKKS